MAKLQLVSPWINFYHEVNALFRYDRDVTVIFDEEETEVKLYVNGGEKAEALSELLPDIRNRRQKAISRQPAHALRTS